ncbi:sulfotransferase [Halomonas sp. H5]|uniref:sulfotransferase n=1 Tax=Halomonas sp. H5 TaxID=3423910 RepID=UPI003D35BD63
MRIVVIGMHRSGTSIVAKILEQLGCNMGESLLPSSASNVDGHYEDLRFYELNSLIFSRINKSWDNPPSQREVLENSELIYNLYLDEISDRSGFWGFKEPRTSVLLPAIQDLLCDFKVVYCLRDGADVARSLHTRNGIDVAEGLNLKEIYDKACSDFYENHGGDKIKIYYSDLVSEPEEAVKKIASFVNMAKDESAIINASLIVKDKQDLSRKKFLALIGDVFISIKRAIKSPGLLFTKKPLNKMRYWVRNLVEIIARR